MLELADEDESLRCPRSRRPWGGCSGEIDRLEEEALFTGEYDAGPAIVTISAGAGGTDAMDWAEMLPAHVPALGRAPQASRPS